jgi:hypothetical protein
MAVTCRLADSLLVAPGRVLADRRGVIRGKVVIATNAARLGALPLRWEGVSMVHARVVNAVSDDPQAMFRKAMAGATDILWNLRYDDEALSALHDIIEQATIQREAGEDRRDDVSE